MFIEFLMDITTIVDSAWMFPRFAQWANESKQALACAMRPEAESGFGAFSAPALAEVSKQLNHN